MRMMLTVAIVAACMMSSATAQHIAPDSKDVSYVVNEGDPAVTGDGVSITNSSAAGTGKVRVTEKKRRINGELETVKTTITADPGVSLTVTLPVPPPPAPGGPPSPPTTAADTLVILTSNCNLTFTGSGCGLTTPGGKPKKTSGIHVRGGGAGDESEVNVIGTGNGVTIRGSSGSQPGANVTIPAGSNGNSIGCGSNATGSIILTGNSNTVGLGGSAVSVNSSGLGNVIGNNFPN